MASAAPNFVIGIDLGTVNAVVAVPKEGGTAEILTNAAGDRNTPCFVSFTDEEKLHGSAAEHLLARNPANTVFDSLKILGLRFHDREVQDQLKHWPFRVVAGEDDMPTYDVQFQGTKLRLTPLEVIVGIFKTVKKTAEDALGRRVDFAVVTVPVHFSRHQRELVVDAAKRAKLTVLRCINAPTAAVLAHGIESAPADVATAAAAEEDEDDADADADEGAAPAEEAFVPVPGEEHVIVVDAGSAVAVTVYRVRGGLLQMLGTTRDHTVSAADLDDVLLQHLMQKFNKEHKVDMSQNKRAVSKLRTYSQHVKHALSHGQDTHVTIESLHEGIDFNAGKLNRARYEMLCARWFRSAVAVVQQALAATGVAKAAVSRVVMVGGASTIPRMQKSVQDFFGKRTVVKTQTPSEMCALGAALEAGLLAALDLNDEAKVAVLTSTEGDNPAVFGLPSSVPTLPRSIGIAAADGSFVSLVCKGTPLPAVVHQTFSTSEDDQDAVWLQVYEGEEATVAENRLVAQVQLSGIPAAPADTPRIRVTLSVSREGELEVKANAGDADVRVVVVRAP